MPTTKKPAMKNAAAQKNAKKPAKKPSTKSSPANGATDMMYQPVEAFPLPGEAIPDEFPGDHPVLPWNIDSLHTPCAHAIEHAPPGWLYEWDFFSREQKLYIWYHFKEEAVCTNCH